MKELYQALAPFYDAFNGDLDYQKWADFIEESFHRYYPEKVESVLDLACGTGRMTEELCRRGYDMIGVDISPDMLSVARDSAEKKGMAERILYLCQDMCDFELYGTVEAVVCCLDAVNHVTDRTALSRCFHWVHNYLVPNGIFLFDVNSPYKFREIYGDRAYVLEDDGVLCAWQNHFSERTRLCDFYISLFSEKEDGNYERTDTVRTERMYTITALTRLLKENGFELLYICSDFSFENAKETDERYYVAARAVKEP
ncbi:MAG: class I SAM-dependent methyltransferase [Clostridia bacterium]|nr:class I SAM-dependent methyltransferase [Clostridia bacterium]